MKNIFLALMIVVLILSIVPVAVHADEISIDDVVTEEIVTEAVDESVYDVVTEPTEDTDDEIETPSETETPTETPQETPTSGELEEVATLITRMQEAWENGDISLVVTLALDAALFVIIERLKKTGSKNVDVVVEKGRELTKGFNTVVDAANEITNAINGDDGLKHILESETKKLTDSVQDGLAAIQKLDKEKLLQYGAQLTATTNAVKCLAEMLQTVYANSTTIPMPVKNIINEKYVEICKNLNSDNGGDTNAQC